MERRFVILWAWMVVFTAPGPLLGATEHRNLDHRGIALAGYDPVEYVDYGLALKGFTDIEAERDGARYRFRSVENRDRFLADPAAYEPAFGGWCAYSLAMNPEETGYPRGKYPVDPESFKIIDGRLYLFYKDRDFDGLEQWNQRDQNRLIDRADRQWRILTRSR